MRRNVEVRGGQAKCIKHSHINQDLQRQSGSFDSHAKSIYYARTS